MEVFEEMQLQQPQLDQPLVRADKAAHSVLSISRRADRLTLPCCMQQAEERTADPECLAWVKSKLLLVSSSGSSIHQAWRWTRVCTHIC